MILINPSRVIYISNGDHDNPHEPPQIESEGCDISHNALYSHQIDLAKESEDFEKLFYIYQHFQESEKIHQMDTDSDLLTIEEGSLYPYINNDIEYGLFEDLVESYHLDRQIKDDFQCDPDCYIQTSQLIKHDYFNICTHDYQHITQNINDLSDTMQQNELYSSEESVLAAPATATEESQHLQSLLLSTLSIDDSGPPQVTYEPQQPIATSTP